VKPLGPIGTEKLIRRAAAYAKFVKPLDAFIEHIHTFNITSPGVILQSLENYIAGSSAKDSIATSDALSVTTLRICQALLRGDWPTIRNELKKATTEDGRMIRGAVVGYLRTVMLGDKMKTAAACAATIEDLAAPGPMEEGMFLPWMMAVLFRTCKRFSQGV
jgi:hypothetical protein